MDIRNVGGGDFGEDLRECGNVVQHWKLITLSSSSSKWCDAAAANDDD